MRILALDLETAPTLAWTWSTFKANIGYNQIVSPPRIICASYHWFDEDEVGFISEYHDGRDDMLLKLWDLVDEADIVVGYNIQGFDNKWVSSEFISEGMRPPSPFQSIDLYQTLKRHSKFPSKKLAYVAPHLLQDSKVTHSGFDLWIGCMNNDPASWEIMKSYCIQDTALMKPLYEKLKPWVPNHPNLALDLEPGVIACPTCTSTNINFRGYRYTNASRYRRFVCTDCGRWSKASSRESTTALRNA